MSRGASKAAQQQLDLERQTSAQYGDAASGIGSKITPFLTREMDSPTGLGEGTMNDMLTANSQATGGVLGQAKNDIALRGARSGNASYGAAAGDQYVRDAMANESSGVLKVKLADAAEKMAQQQAGESGLQQLHGTDVGASINALGMGNGSIQAWNQADANTLSSIMAPFTAIADLGKAAGSVMTGMGAMCAVAEALWGKNDTRTHVFRSWLHLEFETKGFFARKLVAIYRAVGLRVSKNAVLVSMLKPLFEMGLVRAYRWWKNSQLKAWQNRWVN